ncbi:hypothetical protein ElyMa_006240400 [Elysia marginata]|uniref:Uncharacterized protein n=1 Tax=Elysia marginata TaxID=1093978 RepID=A0AAV4H8I0_9GAST|nr:hypothetical protein ElyMa_006240400 [Elysia marginata]
MKEMFRTRFSTRYSSGWGLSARSQSGRPATRLSNRIVQIRRNTARLPEWTVETRASFSSETMISMPRPSIIGCDGCLQAVWGGVLLYGGVVTKWAWCMNLRLTG